MPDTKITALTALTAADPANDVLPIVDVSDTTMAASGTTKKISINNILGASGTATLASATISGAASAASLTVTGSTIPTNGLYLPTTNTLEFAANSLAQYRIAPLGVFSWYDGAGGTRMTLNSNGLGVGVTPTAGRGALQLSSGINFPATQVASTDANTLDDYEEGTWTGTLKGLTTDPTTPVTATGRYTKIGRQVSVDINFSGVNTTGASGQIKVSGVPFTSNGTVPSTGPVMMSSIGTFTGVPVAFIGTGTTEIELYAFSSAGAQTFVTHNAGTARSLWVSLTYTV